MNAKKITEFAALYGQFLDELSGDIIRLLQITGPISRDDESPAEIFSTKLADDLDIHEINSDGYIVPEILSRDSIQDLIKYGDIPFDDAFGIWHHLKQLANEQDQETEEHQPEPMSEPEIVAGVFRYLRNIPHDFIDKIWGENPNLANHLNLKLMLNCEKKRLYVSPTAVSYFEATLDAGNTKMFHEAIVQYIKTTNS